MNDILSYSLFFYFICGLFLLCIIFHRRVLKQILNNGIVKLKKKTTFGTAVVGAAISKIPSSIDRHSFELLPSARSFFSSIVDFENIEDCMNLQKDCDVTYQASWGFKIHEFLVQSKQRLNASNDDTFLENNKEPNSNPTPTQDDNPDDLA